MENLVDSSQIPCIFIPLHLALNKLNNLLFLPLEDIQLSTDACSAE